MRQSPTKEISSNIPTKITHPTYFPKARVTLIQSIYRKFMIKNTKKRLIMAQICSVNRKKSISSLITEKKLIRIIKESCRINLQCSQILTHRRWQYNNLLRHKGIHKHNSHRKIL